MTSAGAVVAEQAAGPPVPAFGGTYVEGVTGVPQYLNPIIAATSLDQDVAQLAFSGLTRFGRRGEIEADLASSFRLESEGRVWIFEIRPDATWHDGRPVSADDVVYTVRLLQDPAYVGPYAEAFRGVIVERIAARTVRFELPDGFGPFGASTTAPLLPSHILGGTPYAGLAAAPFNIAPVGTGPFRVSEVGAQQVTLVRNDDFYRSKPGRSRPYLDRIVLRHYVDASAALAALARGEIDGVGGLTENEADRARGLPNVALYSLPTSDFTALFLNLRPEKAQFRERVVRQAIATAIDRGRILTAAAGGRGVVADSFVPRTSWAYVDDIPRFAHDPREAREMLDGADWIDHDGDGVRDKDGVALSFSVSTSDEPARIAAGRRVVEDLRDVGMDVRLRSVPFAELVDGVARTRSFDALVLGITVGGDPDPYPFFHSQQVADPGYNFSGYSTLPLDRNLEAARRAFDRDERRNLYAPVFEAIATEVPVVFLYFSDYLYAQARTVQGQKIAPVSDPTQRFWDVQDWYVRTERR
ncbi:MAG: peptide ABC transporter substrate-binding protein [Candidatus Limnocylindria bacterium]